MAIGPATARLGFGILLAGICAIGTPAIADPALCRQLAAELADLSAADEGERADYDRAIDVQRGEIRKVEDRAAGAGCGPAPTTASPGQCGGYGATLAEMRSNLAGLLEHQAEAAGGVPNRHRDHLVAAFTENDCDELSTGTAEPEPLEHDPEKSTDFSDEITAEVRASAGVSGRMVIVPGMADPDGIYRTACVRTCDGYYFPLSPASSPADFPRDRDACEAQCPGADVEMYYQDSGVDDPAGMLSTATGKPYSALPQAFVYRRTDVARPASCGCTGRVPREASGAMETPGRPPGAPSQSDGSIVTFGEGPATRPVTTALPPPEKRKVRVVGPTFLPDRQGAIDLRAPAPKTGP